MNLKIPNCLHIKSGDTRACLCKIRDISKIYGSKHGRVAVRVFFCQIKSMSTLRYLNGTSTHSLFFHRDNDFHLQCFNDSDWSGCPDDHCFTSGYGIYIGNSLIS